MQQFLSSPYSTGLDIRPESMNEGGVKMLVCLGFWSFLAWASPLQLMDTSVHILFMTMRVWPFVALSWVLTKAWLDGGKELTGFCREIRAALEIWSDVIMWELMFLPVSIGMTVVEASRFKFTSRLKDGIEDDIRSNRKNYGMHLDTIYETVDHRSKRVLDQGESMAEVVELAATKSAEAACTVGLGVTIATSVAYAQSYSPSPIPLPKSTQTITSEAKVDMKEIMINLVGTGDSPQRVRTEIGGFVRRDHFKVYLYNLCDFTNTSQHVSCLGDVFLSDTRRPWLIGMTEIAAGTQTKFSMTVGPRINLTSVPTIGSTVSKVFKNLALMPLSRVVGPAPPFQLRIAVKTLNYPIANKWTGYTEVVYSLRPGRQDYSFIDSRVRHKSAMWFAPGIHYEPFQHRFMVGARLIL